MYFFHGCKKIWPTSFMVVISQNQAINQLVSPWQPFCAALVYDVDPSFEPTKFNLHIRVQAASMHACTTQLK